MNKNNLKIIIFVVVILIGIITFVYKNTFKNDYDNNYEDVYIDNLENVQSVNNNDTPTSQVETEKIKIHIIGEVKNPGIYEIESGSRIQDAIIAAGGQSENADLNKVNLAYELEDGQKIQIPSIFDKQNAYIYNDEGINVIASDENSSSLSKQININKANSEELQKINGVGPALAEKIIAYREQNGKFKKIEDLKNVSGIGDKKYETLKEYITVK